MAKLDRSHTENGVRYAERAAPGRKSGDHICAGCAALVGGKVDHDLCKKLPPCAAGSVREKIVWVDEKEVAHA